MRTFKSWTTIVVMAAVWLVLSDHGFAEEAMFLLPSSISLSTTESSQQLVVQMGVAELPLGQATGEVQWTSANPAVATVSEAGVVRPVSDGETEIIATCGAVTAKASVTVRGSNVSHRWSFRNDVQPILAKAGCNMGACHGALAGKGGFRLSLRGYDAAADYHTIVQQDRGRRIEFTDPGRSLILAKPSGGIPHNGGIRFDTDSREYQILSEWISNGATPPSQDEATVDQLTILPGRSIQQVGQTQQMLVSAHLTDGRIEDVTRWVKWSSSNEAVVTVDDKGVATLIGPGEGAIVGWYSSQIAIARLTVPYAKRDGDATTSETTESSPEKIEPRNFIDIAINKQLDLLNLPASKRCDDATFIRRAFIDTIGVLPTAEETRLFLADGAVDKRDQLIEALLNRPEFVDYWTHHRSDILMLNGTLLRPEALKSYYEWIRGHVEKNTPWDQFVREILTATGSSHENGATNFYALHQTPEEMTENASQGFLGLSIGCAKCHNHPLEKWTNDQYYAMSNLFARVKAKGWGGEPRNGSGLRTLYVSETGDLVQPRTGKPQPPTPLDGTPLAIDAPEDRRVALAAWMTSPENPYFARSITNRIWANFFGVGLVESVDDMRVSNPASNEELLDAASQHLIDNHFDLKSLMRVILQSNAYQRSSVPLEGNKDEHRFYSRYYPRRMKAEVLHDAVVQTTGVPTAFTQVAFPGSDFQKTEFYPLGTKAIQLYDSAIDNYFLQAFGRNQRRITCECERSDEPSMVQVLHLSNGNTLNDKLKQKEGRVSEFVKRRAEGLTDAQLLEEIYFATLSRQPTAKEVEEIIAQLPAPGGADEHLVLEDVYWAILSSREFVFNH